MTDVFCGRVGCGESAVAVLLMSPQDTQAWIVAPDHESAPEGVPLCATHADRISVPFGWTLVDDRPAPKKRRRKKKASESSPEPQLLAGSTEPTAQEETIPESEVGLGDGFVAEPIGDLNEAPGADLAAPESLVEAAQTLADRPVSNRVQLGADDSDDSAPAAVVAVDAGSGAGEQSPAKDRPGYVAPEHQFREDGAPPSGPDEPTMQMPAIATTAPATPAQVPLDADRVAASVSGESPRLSVVPGDDDPQKTYDFSEKGQGAFWNEPEPAETDPDERTPLLQRAFRVVRDD